MSSEQILSPSVFNETDHLVTVVLGNPETYSKEILDTTSPNNPTAAATKNSGGAPPHDQVLREFEAFHNQLDDLGVDVITVDALDREDGFFKSQLYARDIGFVIANQFFVSRLRLDNRMAETRGLASVIDMLEDDSAEHVGADTVIEGGDIISQNGNLFVGISQRTTAEGAKYLQETVGNALEVVPVPLKAVGDNENVLHLDCAFMPVGKRSALVYSPGFVDMPEQIKDGYDLIELTFDEQQALGTNVLSVSPEIVISRHSSTRVNRLMRETGIHVVELEFDAAPQLGGSFRCATLPITRFV